MFLSYEDTLMLETPQGGYKHTTLALLGVDFPLKPGWRNKLMKRDIPENLFLAAIHDSELPKISNKSKRKNALKEAHLRFSLQSANSPLDLP